MTRNDIKVAATNGYANWEILTMVVNDGIEFPDAVVIVAAALRLPKDEVEQMKWDYDDFC
jgi:hypothetical protein